MSPERRRLPALLMLVLLLSAGACSSDKHVGEGLEVEKGENQAACRLGECTTTTAPATTSTTQASTTTTTARKTTATAPTTTTTRPAAAFTIKIQPDKAGRVFEPSAGRVRAGSTVRWTNTDTVTRSVVADDGRFTSPDIPPGGSFDFVAGTPGRYDYHDGTRPYAVAYFEVV